MVFLPEGSTRVYLSHCASMDVASEFGKGLCEGILEGKMHRHKQC